MSYLYGAASIAVLGFLALLYKYKTGYETERSKRASLESEHTLWDTLAKRKQADKEADDAEGNYRATRDEYLKSKHDDGSDEDT